MNHGRLSVFAAPLLALAMATPVLAAEPAGIEECAAERQTADSASDGRSSLAALRPTLRIVAADYDRKADELAREAERYRAWASAQEMFASSPYGKRYARRHLADEANALEAAAAQNHALALKYRALANSSSASGC